MLAVEIEIHPAGDVAGRRIQQREAGAGCRCAHARGETLSERKTDEANAGIEHHRIFVLIKSHNLDERNDGVVGRLCLACRRTAGVLAPDFHVGIERCRAALHPTRGEGRRQRLTTIDLRIRCGAVKRIRQRRCRDASRSATFRNRTDVHERIAARVVSAWTLVECDGVADQHVVEKNLRPVIRGIRWQRGRTF